MKTKIGIYLSADVARRFKIATRRRKATKSDLVNEGLCRFFQPPASEADRSDEVLQLMTKLEKRLRRLQREFLVTTETLALFVRYSLMVMAPIPEDERQAAEALGRKRSQVFIREVALRVASDKGMIPDVIRTIVRTHPHLVAEAMAEARREDAVGDMFSSNGQGVGGMSHA
jgi:hypothetical protein